MAYNFANKLTGFSEKEKDFLKTNCCIFFKTKNEIRIFGNDLPLTLFCQIIFIAKYILSKIFKSRPCTS